MRHRGGERYVTVTQQRRWQTAGNRRPIAPNARCAVGSSEMLARRVTNASENQANVSRYASGFVACGEGKVEESGREG